MDSHPPPSPAFCLHELQGRYLLCITPSHFWLYSSLPLRLVCDGDISAETSPESGHRQVVMTGHGDDIDNATQLAVIDCWYSHYVSTDGQEPFAIQRRLVDESGAALSEITRGMRAIDDDEGMN